MISKLRGLLDSTSENSLILDVNGVGYRVFCSSKTLSKMPPIGQTATLLIETQVREDHIHLFGFFDALEKNAFSLLTSVQGVGAKVGLAILSALSSEELSLAIASNDSKSITRALGVGPKLAVRIVTELKGKVGSLSTATMGTDTIAGSVLQQATNSVIEDAISALVNLGYARMQAAMSVSKSYKERGETAKVDELIKDALKDLAL